MIVTSKPYKEKMLRTILKPDQIIYQDDHCMFARYLGFVNQTFKDTDTLITVVNSSIGDLFLFIYQKITGHPLFQNRIIVEADGELKNKIIFTNADLYRNGADKAMKWKKENSYSCELKLDEHFNGSRYKLLLQSLNNFLKKEFGITGGFEKRETPCYILVRTSDSDKLRSRPGIISGGDQGNFYSFPNEEIKKLIEFFNTSPFFILNKPLIDETNYENRINIRINVAVSQIKELNDELKKYDLTIIEAVRKIDMVIFKKMD